MLTLTNARLFDGLSMRSGRYTVTIEGNRILSVDDGPTNSATALDLSGMVLMPGLITSHLHPDFYRYPIEKGLAGIPLGKELPPGVLMAIGVRTCRVLLESGFTGYNGASCSNNIDVQLKMAIEDDIVPGPRIRACGHHIGTTGDLNYKRQKWWFRPDMPGSDIFGDGPDELRKLVRQEIGQGVETIKIFASDGHDVSYTTRNMTRSEIATIVETAHALGAKVRAHVCSKQVMMECIELGVDLIDHGDEIDEECIEAMVKAGTCWVPSQRYTDLLLGLGFGDADGELQRQFDNVRRLLPVAHKAGVCILLGDDYSGVFRDHVENDPLDHQVGNYGSELAYYAQVDGLSPTDVLSWATRNPGRMLTGPAEKLGVIEPGALADLIVIDGDPLADIELFAHPQTVLKAVIRDGSFVIDRLSTQAGQ